MENISPIELLEAYEYGSRFSHLEDYFELWGKVKNWIGVNKILFVYAEGLHTNENKTTVITNDSILEIKMNHREFGSFHLMTTPIRVTECKKVIKEKDYSYTNQSDWEVNFIYDDDSILSITPKVLKSTYFEIENDKVFLYLIKLY